MDYTSRQSEMAECLTMMMQWRHHQIQCRRETEDSLTSTSDVLTLTELEALLRSGAVPMFKLGRTTGKTRGELNRIHASTRVAYAVLKDGKKKEADAVGKTILAVAPPGGTRTLGSSGRNPVSVGAEGDSGSPCYDHRGRLVRADTTLWGILSTGAEARQTALEGSSR
jgi:hypothetical protein